MRMALGFALGEPGDPHDADAVKLALRMDGVDVNEPNIRGQAFLFVECCFGRSRNVEILLADLRVDPNLAESVQGHTPLYDAAGAGKVRCVALLLADERVDPNLPDSAVRRTRGGTGVSNFSLRTLESTRTFVTGKATPP